MEIQQRFSSSSSKRYIFLSFSVETRKTFTDSVYKALSNAGYLPFRDTEDILIGEPIETEVERGIEQSIISIIIISEDYGSSEACLNGLLHILKRKMVDDRYIIFPIFYRVEPRHVGNQEEGSFREAFDKYESSGEHSKEKIDQWRKALKKVSKMGGKVLPRDSDRYESEFINEIEKLVGTMLQRKFQDVSSFTVGMLSRVKDIDRWLKDPAADARIAVITGNQGTGKTTVAKVTYDMNAKDFEASCFLENIREASQKQNGLVGLQRQLLSCISGVELQNVYNMDDDIVNKIQDVLWRKRTIVILDSVDKIEHVVALIGARKSFHKGSRIIITTSRPRLLSHHKKHKSFYINPLDNHESLNLFCLHAFRQERPMDGYLELSETLIAPYQGNPFTLKVLGSSLFGKSLKVWESTSRDRHINKTLELSYNLLDSHEQQLFLKIALSFVGKDRNEAAEEMSKEHSFYSEVGMRNLMNRSLVSIDYENKLIMNSSVLAMATRIKLQDTFGGPEKHLPGTQTEAVTSGGSILCNSIKNGKRKQVEGDENESMPQNEERSGTFKRLCLGLFSFFEPPAIHLKKLLRF